MNRRVMLVLAAGAVTAAVTTRSTLPAHRWWGWLALAAYVVSALVAVAPHPAVRRWWSAVAMTGAAMVPLAVLVIGRSRGWHHVAQSEVDVIEAAARRLVHHGTPYLDPAAMTPAQRVTHYSYVPYLPAVSLAGIPRAVLGTHAWTDARLWLALADVALWRAIWRRCSAATRDALVLIAVSPLVTLPIVVGGHDVVIASLLVLGAVAAAEGVGAVALGGAAGVTYLTWPLGLPLAGVDTIRARWKLIVGVVAVTAVPILVDPVAAYRNLVLFPLGRTPARSPADAPSIGRLLTHVPGGRVIDLIALVATVVVITAVTWRSRPTDVGHALVRGALGFAVLIALVPSSRVGYLLYPVTFWALGRTLSPRPATARSALRSVRPSPPDGR